MKNPSVPKPSVSVNNYRNDLRFVANREITAEEIAFYAKSRLLTFVKGEGPLAAADVGPGRHKAGQYVYHFRKK